MSSPVGSWPSASVFLTWLQVLFSLMCSEGLIDSHGQLWFLGYAAEEVVLAVEIISVCVSDLIFVSSFSENSSFPRSAFSLCWHQKERGGGGGKEVLKAQYWDVFPVGDLN